MQDNNRATGRTTRMLLQAVEYLIKHPNKSVCIVCHNVAGWQWMSGYMKTIVSEQLCRRMELSIYQNWQNSNIGKRDNFFFDHHCFYTERHNLETQLKVLQSKIERIDEDYHKYDA